MNAVFIVIFITGTATLFFIAPDKVTSAMLDGADSAIALTIKLLAIYAVWLSVLKIMEATGLDKKLTAAFRPLTRRLFPGENERAQNYIAVNLASNMLGLGGAATPAGINAVREMDKGEGRATKNMIMLTVISATSIQLLPATVISLMSAAGSTAPSSIILPSLISTAVSTIFGIILVKAFVR